MNKGIVLACTGVIWVWPKDVITSELEYTMSMRVGYQ